MLKSLNPLNTELSGGLGHVVGGPCGREVSENGGVGRRRRVRGKSSLIGEAEGWGCWGAVGVVRGKE